MGNCNTRDEASVLTPQAQAQECPCGITREELVANGALGLGPGMVCISLWADGSGQVCGHPLSAHPRQQAPQALPQQQTGVKSSWMIHYII